MPKSAPRPCRSPGCPNVTNELYCNDHEDLAPKRPWEKRPSAAMRGYGHGWRKLRRMVLRREPLCRECAQHGRVQPATDVDHIVPRSRGGRDVFDNLQPLCHSCHSKKTAVQTREGEGG